MDQSFLQIPRAGLSQGQIEYRQVIEKGLSDFLKLHNQLGYSSEQEMICDALQLLREKKSYELASTLEG